MNKARYVMFFVGVFSMIMHGSENHLTSPIRTTLNNLCVDARTQLFEGHASAQMRDWKELSNKYCPNQAHIHLQMTDSGLCAQFRWKDGITEMLEILPSDVSQEEYAQLKDYATKEKCT